MMAHIANLVQGHGFKNFAFALPFYTNRVKIASFRDRFVRFENSRQSVRDVE